MWFKKTKETNPSALTGIPYWYTGCCNGEQVVGISTVDFNGAYKEMNSQCNGTVVNQRSGNYGTVPAVDCVNSDTNQTKIPDGPCSKTKPYFNYYTGECVATEEEIKPRIEVKKTTQPKETKPIKKAPKKAVKKNSK